MVEPKQKRSKTLLDRLDHDPTAVANSHAAVEVKPDPIDDEFQEFETGRNEPVGAFRGWGGPFRGRAQLYRELLPAIKRRLIATEHKTARRKHEIDNLRTSLRAWWRLLDQYDEDFPVRSVLDLDDTHGALQMRHGLHFGYTDDFLVLANEARAQLGARQLSWPRNRPEGTLVDLPLQEHVRSVYHALKREVRAMWWRWQAADTAAEQGKNWDGLELTRGLTPWTEQDIHATYRGLSKRLGHPCPSIERCRQSIEIQHGIFIERLTPAVFGQFPTREDIQACCFLFLLRTGWNAPVAFNLNVEKESNWFRPHPTSERHHVVFATKERGNTEQIAIGLTKSDLSPGTLIHALLERTRPLREFLRKELSELLRHPLTPATQRRIDDLRALVRSPWIYVHSRGHFEILGLGTRDYAKSSTRQRLHELIEILNADRPANDQIPDMSIGDFRDAFISYAYQHSGYSWLIAQLAAGHKSVESLKTYLRKRRHHAHGASELLKFGNAMWGEIRVHRCVDAAILFAMVQRGEVTPEQRDRWLAYKDRTRVGMGCRDFKNPPTYIAPHHVKGAGCRVQRCVLCEHGVVFDDSMNHLCRRCAELRHLKGELPLVTWLESSFCDELERTEAVLEANFDRELVALTVQAWADDIAAGRQCVLSMEGEYGTAET
ncbi:conserved hypothetical protein [Paraburkholderia sabiae]|uniref:hypothetical protein n=1 Tax=Paraburkholderia sabiae TaxID=273251 RepID=UPI001CB238B8|nr:hypothetical protein [Paraburkholderia sabiae]CAG9226138.1 conserved hypothetical protein [Paraburkholderia sabiae]